MSAVTAAVMAAITAAVMAAITAADTVDIPAMTQIRKKAKERKKRTAVSSPSSAETAGMTMTTISIRGGIDMDLSKSFEYFDPNAVDGKCHIIGCGSVGSTIAENLARLGITKFVLYDFDIVEPHNLANQMFVNADIKKPKIEATKRIITDINPEAESTIELHPEGYTGQKLNGYVFLAVDNIDLRRDICTKQKQNQNIKLNNLLITESVKQAILTYLSSIKHEFDLDDFLFASKKTGKKMYEEHGWRILSSAGKALGLPITIGSHTMRKSFANIAACVDKSCIDMNAVTKIQGLLNHSDQRVTMKYLGTYQDMFDRARIAVSDFVLGKTGVEEIIAGNQYTVDDVIGRLDALENILSTEKETKQ